MGDAFEELVELIESAGLRITLDPGRSTADACVGCGRTDVARRLVEVGAWIVNLRGGLRAGDSIDRPMCATCERTLLQGGTADE